MGAIPLRDEQGPPPAGELLIQPDGDLLQRGQAAFEIQDRPREAPGLALPQELLAQRAGLAQAVEVVVVHHHQPTLGDGGVSPKQVGPGPQTVRQMGGGGLPAPEGGQLPGR